MKRRKQPMKVTTSKGIAFNTVKTKRIAMTTAELAIAFGISKQTVASRIKEIEEEVSNKRYGPHSVIHDVGYVAVNPLVFADYLTYRSRLRNKNLRKNVPDYDPFETARELQLQTEPDDVSA